MIECEKHGEVRHSIGCYDCAKEELAQVISRAERAEALNLKYKVKYDLIISQLKSLLTDNLNNYAIHCIRVKFNSIEGLWNGHEHENAGTEGLAPSGLEVSKVVNDKPCEEDFSLDSSSAHRAAGILSPNRRRMELKRIIKELRLDDPKDVSEDEISGAQDLCWRLFSKEVSEELAKKLCSDITTVRRALNDAILWSPNTTVGPGGSS